MSRDEENIRSFSPSVTYALPKAQIFLWGPVESHAFTGDTTSMLLFENPVLQRELLVNLRMHRAFALLFAYVALMGAVVWVAWPQAERVNFENTAEAKRLFDMFVLGQFVLVSMMAPSFAAGSITGEKERKTYEMLLASPLQPSAVLMGKLLTSLCYLGLLIFSSLPIVMICLPLGGVSFYEVLAAYFVLILAAGTFGMISTACSSYFQRTSASLAVSYLLILPLALMGVLIWEGLSGEMADIRLLLTCTLLPAGCAILWVTLFASVSARLLHPPDVGSEGKEVFDEEKEQEQAVGMVIQRDQFPDMLFAPARRNDLLGDGTNPVFDKEMRSEIFSQGTLMLRLVIQVSMFLAIFLMGFFLFIFPKMAPWYVSYVILFNMLVGPVYAAGCVTSERERETLDLLLTTMLRSIDILWPKIVAGLRVSTVLTLFLAPPILLAGAMVSELQSNWPALLTYLLIILMTCLTTTTLATFWSVIFRKTSTSLAVSYLSIVILFAGPMAATFFTDTFFSRDVELRRTIEPLTITSPFSAAVSVPLYIDVTPADTRNPPPAPRPIHWYFLGFYTVANLVLMGTMLQIFHYRWREAQN